MKKIHLIFIFLVFILSLASCKPITISSPNNPWEYGDLRSLSSTDPIPPDFDLIAAYMRWAGTDIQIRLDLLDLTYEINSDIYIALDTDPGGTHCLPFTAKSEIAWDTLLFLPASGNPRALKPSQHVPNTSKTDCNLPVEINENLIPRISRLPWIDAIIISFNPQPIGGLKTGFKFQVFVLPKGERAVIDSLGTTRSDSSPQGQVPLLLAFWNTFPAYTPAQALRRWDGAHTGPYGERHGLNVLLQNVRHSKVPVILLDLKNSAYLSALEYMGSLKFIHELAAEGLIILPDNTLGSPSYSPFPDGLPDWAYPLNALENQEIALRFGLPLSKILYSPHLSPSSTKGYSFVFTHNKDMASIPPNQIAIPIPPRVSDDPQATKDGLSIDLRRELLKNALATSHGNKNIPVLMLGGSLTDSTFGDPKAASATFNYIAAHPWMHSLNMNDLMAISPKIKFISPSDNSPKSEASITVPSFQPYFQFSNPRIQTNNPLYEAAWQAASALYLPMPPEHPLLLQLRSKYTNQIGVLLAAAHWADQPYAIRNCSLDLDGDGKKECMLANNRYCAIFDLEGALLKGFFAETSTGIHQIIAPTSQFIVGLGDPNLWNFTFGDSADPGGISGAFSDTPPPWKPYKVSFVENGIIFTSPDGSIQKTFILSQIGLKVEYAVSGPIDLRIPIALDPWERFSPGWETKYSGHPILNGWSWVFGDKLRLDIITDQKLDSYPFNQNKLYPDIPEDPNFGYPAGHYLPFPVNLTHILGNGHFQIELIVTPNP